MPDHYRTGGSREMLCVEIAIIIIIMKNIRKIVAQYAMAQGIFSEATNDFRVRKDNVFV